MKFKTLAILTSIVAFILGSVYLFAGAIMVGRWQIEPSVGILLLCKRIGSLYIGLSIMYFLSRSEPPSKIRMALCAGTTIALGLLSIMGIYELLIGHAGSGILASIILEALIAFGFFLILIKDRKVIK